jgi:hypothetical protein
VEEKKRRKKQELVVDRQPTDSSPWVQGGYTRLSVLLVIHHRGKSRQSTYILSSSLGAGRTHSLFRLPAILVLFISTACDPSASHTRNSIGKPKSSLNHPCRERPRRPSKTAPPIYPHTHNTHLPKVFTTLRHKTCHAINDRIKLSRRQLIL